MRVRTVFETGKPHFVNHPMMVGDHGERYASVSCYNSLKIGGGAHTLVRLNLKEVALLHTGTADEFLATTLPHYVELTAELAEARIRSLVEDQHFFDTHWLATEGLIDIDRFSAMFGIFGLAECVNLLMAYEGRDRDGEARYGHDADANALAIRVVERVAELVAARPMPYCEGGGGRCYLHSQSGIDLDEDVTAGTRIPVGDEPGLLEHIATCAPHHHLFASGVSDIFHVDETALRNPEAMVDIIRGGVRQRHARLHVQPRQQRVRADHRVSGAQERPRHDRRVRRRPAHQRSSGGRQRELVPSHATSGEAHRLS